MLVAMAFSVSLACEGDFFIYLYIMFFILPSFQAVQSDASFSCPCYHLIKLYLITLISLRKEHGLISATRVHDRQNFKSTFMIKFHDQVP